MNTTFSAKIAVQTWSNRLKATTSAQDQKFSANKSSAQTLKVQRKTQKFSGKPKSSAESQKVQRTTQKFSAKPKSSAQNPNVQRKTQKFSAKPKSSAQARKVQRKTQSAKAKSSAQVQHTTNKFSPKAILHKLKAWGKNQKFSCKSIKPSAENEWTWLEYSPPYHSAANLLPKATLTPPLQCDPVGCFTTPRVAGSKIALEVLCFTIETAAGGREGRRCQTGGCG